MGTSTFPLPNVQSFVPLQDFMSDNWLFKYRDSSGVSVEILFNCSNGSVTNNYVKTLKKIAKILEIIAENKLI